MDNLDKYNQKRNFNKTKEPKGIKEKSSSKLRFVVQHHMARKEHYDLRLEWNGVLKSWAIPKGPSYNPKNRRLAILVEDHPISYQNFEGTIPKGEYGGGIVMLWDKGYWTPTNDFEHEIKNGSIKFMLLGKRLKGLWTLIHYKDNQWLLCKEKDNYYEFTNINAINRSIKTNRTMEEIEQKKKKKDILSAITITNPDKLIYPDSKITKLDIINYYQKVAKRMLPFLKNRIISTIRCPNGIEKTSFYKKHYNQEIDGFHSYPISPKEKEYYFITNAQGLIHEVQQNGIEFHIWGSNIPNIDEPNYMVFDLDPDETLSLKQLREGVKDLKSILDELNLKSFLKTSGGKGYHVVIPIYDTNWQDFRDITKNIALLMEKKWPDKYTTNISKKKRKKKIFIDWLRNIKGSTSVCPYSLRARLNAPVSFPIAWEDLNKIKPNDITLKKALKLIKKKDPWKNFFQANKKR